MLFFLTINIRWSVHSLFDVDKVCKRDDDRDGSKDTSEHIINCIIAFGASKPASRLVGREHSWWCFGWMMMRILGFESNKITRYIIGKSIVFISRAHVEEWFPYYMTAYFYAFQNLIYRCEIASRTVSSHELDVLSKDRRSSRTHYGHPVWPEIE